MSGYGVMDDGSFRRKTIDAILDDKLQEYRNQLGEDIELRPGSPARQILEAEAAEQARLWQAIEAIYYASFYEDSFGEMLDKHLAFAGFSRRDIRPATGEVVFSRDSPAPDDVTIPSGTVVTTQSTETRPQIPFETTEPATIFEGETEVTASIEALKPWQTDVGEEWLGEETNVESNSIVRFDSPVSGVDDVTNPKQTGDEAEGFTPGRDRESDAELRLRYEQALDAVGSATPNAIRAEVLEASESIINASIDENATPEDNTDDGGLPPHSFEVTVYEESEVPDSTIAQAIFEARPAGITSHGDETGTATLDGVEFDEEFSRAGTLPIEADVQATTGDSFGAEGEQAIEDALIEYIGGETSTGESFPALGIGDDVIHDQAFARVMSVDGVHEATLELGEAGESLSDENVTVAEDEAPEIDSDDITVTVV